MLNLLKKLKPKKKEDNEETEPLVARSPSRSRNTQGASASDTNNRQAEAIFNPEAARAEGLRVEKEIKDLKKRLQDKNLSREDRDRLENDRKNLKIRLATLEDQMIQYSLKAMMLS